MTCFVWKTCSQPKQSNWKQHLCAKWWVSHWISILEKHWSWWVLLEFNTWVCSGEKHFSRRVILPAVAEEVLLGLMKYCLSQVKKQKGPHRREPWQVKSRGEIKTSPPCSQVRPDALKRKRQALTAFLPNILQNPNCFPLRNPPGLMLFAVLWASCTGCTPNLPELPHTAAELLWLLFWKQAVYKGKEVCKPLDFQRSIFPLTLQLLRIQRRCVFAGRPTPPWGLFPEVAHFRVFLPWSFLCKTEDWAASFSI